MGLKLKIANIALTLLLVMLCGTSALAYEVQGSPGFNNGGGVNDIFKNTQPEINNVLKGLSGSGNDSEDGISVKSIFNFEKFSANDISGIIKAVFGLVFKVLAVIVTVTIDALKGILESV